MGKNFLKSLTVENGMVKLYHYSDKKIDSGFIQVNKPYNIHSKNEFRIWGKSRSFFYCNEDGYKFDKGVNTNYLYICYIPINDIYPINDNPYKYKKLDDDYNSFDSYFKQSWDDGFTAWGYFLGGNKNAPIIISFIDLPISESFKISKGGLRIPMDETELDYVIGDILIGEEKYFVIQKGGYPTTLLNCYLSDEKNIKKVMKGYQKTLEVYMWDDLSLKEEFIGDYIKDLKKSKLWIKRLSESLSDKIKSRANDQEKQAIEYYTKKIEEGEWDIPDNIFDKLPDNIKLKYVENIINRKVGFGLTKEKFNSLSNDLKLKYIKYIIENQHKGSVLSDEEFDFAPDELKLKYIKIRLDEMGLGISNYKMTWYIENRNINEVLNLKSRAKEQEKQKEEYIKTIISKGIENINAKDIKTFFNFEKLDIIWKKVIEDLGVLRNYWDYKITDSFLKFTHGNTEVVVIVVPTFGLFKIMIIGKGHFNKGFKKSEFATNYKTLIETLTEILKEGDITNE